MTIETDRAAFRIAVGRIIGERRTALRMSARELGSLVGMSQPVILALESGRKLPSVVRLRDVCIALDLQLWSVIRAAEGRR